MKKHTGNFLILAVLLMAVELRAEPPPSPEHELHHRRRAGSGSGAPAFEPVRFELEGRLEGGDDGAWVLLLPVRLETRRKAALAQGVPLSQIPDQVRRPIQVAPGGPSEVQLDRRRGQRVRALLGRDRSGRTYLFELFVPKGR